MGLFSLTCYQHTRNSHRSVPAVSRGLNDPRTLNIGPSYCATSNIYVSNEELGRVSHSHVPVVSQVDIQMIEFQRLRVLLRKKDLLKAYF